MTEPTDLREITQYGPDKVIISEHGNACPSKRAREEYGINPDVVFVRNDRWCLAAPKQFAMVAYAQWSDAWTHFCIRPSTTLRPISEWSIDLLSEEQGDGVCTET